MSSTLSLSELDLPRRNGELAFDAPWQSTVFALAAAVVDHAFGGDREPFRQQLIKAVAAEPDRPYWESWTAALEALVAALIDRKAVSLVAPVIAACSVEPLTTAQPPNRKCVQPPQRCPLFGWFW